MSPPRWLARLTIPMMVGAALVTNAAIAAADAADDAFLAKLRAIGFTWQNDAYIISRGTSALIARIIGRQTRLPGTSTPAWTRKAFRSKTSHPW
jgi:hypothetical protein